MMDVYRIPHNGNVELRVEYAQYSVVLRSTLLFIPFLTLRRFLREHAGLPLKTEALRSG